MITGGVDASASCEVRDMSDGGLLQKAMEQQSSDTELVADAVVAPPKGGPMFNNGLKIGLALALVSVVSMWIFSSPSIQSDWSFAILIPIVMGGASFWFIWNGIGRKHTEVISVVLILLLASPFMAMSLSSSSLTITDSTLSSDATTITLTIRESGGLLGSASGEADVSVSYAGDEVWTTSMPFAVNLKDGYGDYGQLVLPIVSFYSDNAADDAKYIVSIDVDGVSDTYILNSAHLERTVEQVSNIEKGGYVLKDCDGDVDIILIATGSEVSLAVDSANAMSDKKVRVVSMPCTNAFDEQDQAYRDSVLTPGVKRVAIEAGVADSWYKYVGLDGGVVAMTTFGESAPAADLFKHFGFTVERVVATVESVLG